MRRLLLAVLSAVILASCQDDDKAGGYGTDIEVKEYFKEELDKTRATLYSLSDEPCLVFPMITDIHYLAETSLRPRLIDETVKKIISLSKDVRFDFLACLGDLTQGNKAMSKTEKEVEHVYDQFAKLGIPFYTCIGNHDTNIYYKVGSTYMKDHVFSTEQLFSLYISDIQGVTWDRSSMAGTNFYKDFPDLNIRCIFLNSNEGDDYGFSDETLDWFVKSMNTERDVYVFSHRNPATSSSYHNQDEMTAVMKNASNFKMLFYGHVHYDCEFTAPFSDKNPILAFAQNSHKCYNHDVGESWPDQAVLPKRVLETSDEECFDVVVIRPQSNRVNLVRVGAGVDREFDLITGMSVGESAQEVVSEDVTVSVDFSAGWPFVESCTAVQDQCNDGEVYTLPFTYTLAGVERTMDMKCVISRGKVDDFKYSYVEPTENGQDGHISFENATVSGDGSTYGLLSIPYVEGMYIKSVSVTHCTPTTSERFNILEGFTTVMDYSPAVYVKKNTIKTWDFPLEGSKGTISPGKGKPTSGLRDYSIRMRSPNIDLKRVSFVYSTTKP